MKISRSKWSITAAIVVALFAWYFPYQSNDFRYCINQGGTYPSATQFVSHQVAPAIVLTAHNFSVLRTCLGGFTKSNSEPITALGTILLFAVTLLLAILTANQGDTTRRQLRAYIGLDEDIRAIEQGLVKGKFIFHAVAENFGQTPARKIQYCIKADFFENTARPIFPDPKTIPLGDGVLHPHQKFFIRKDVEKIFSKKELANIFKKNAPGHFYIYGCAVYEDVFGYRRHTNFSCQLVWHRGRNKKPSWMIDIENNDIS